MADAEISSPLALARPGLHRVHRLGDMMDAITPVETRFLPALAEAISEWFPELGGRSFAVSDATISKENVPTLPLVMTAFTRSRADPPAKSNYDQFEIEDAFIVEFWLEPARYKRANGTETPFWSYYNYENVRDTLLANLIRWESPGGERVAYRTMMIEADALAVTITFGFVATFRWCSAIPVDQGQPFTLKVGLKPDTSCCIPEEPDPCQ